MGSNVQALLPFPSVLGMMAGDMPWTEELGNAFLADQAGVMDAVQRMRHEASEFGYLRSTPDITVTGGTFIEIDPVDPYYIQVPSLRSARRLRTATAGRPRGDGRALRVRHQDRRRLRAVGLGRQHASAVAEPHHDDQPDAVAAHLDEPGDLRASVHCCRVMRGNSHSSGITCSPAPRTIVARTLPQSIVERSRACS